MTLDSQLRTSAVGRPSPGYTQVQSLWEFPAPTTTSTATLVNTVRQQLSTDADNVSVLSLERQPTSDIARRVFSLGLQDCDLGFNSDILDSPSDASSVLSQPNFLCL